MSSYPCQWTPVESNKTPLTACANKRKADVDVNESEEGILDGKRKCFWSSGNEVCMQFQNKAETANQSCQGQPDQTGTMTENRDCIVFETGIKNATVSGCDSSEMDVDFDTNNASIDSQQRSQQPVQQTEDTNKSQASYGAVNPTSGGLRCFCRPSWDAMICRQPFDSDYY